MKKYTLLVALTLCAAYANATVVERSIKQTHFSNYIKTVEGEQTFTLPSPKANPEEAKEICSKNIFNNIMSETAVKTFCQDGVKTCYVMNPDQDVKLINSKLSKPLYYKNVVVPLKSRSTGKITSCSYTINGLLYNTLKPVYNKATKVLSVPGPKGLFTMKLPTSKNVKIDSFRKEGGTSSDREWTITSMNIVLSDPKTQNRNTVMVQTNIYVDVDSDSYKRIKERPLRLAYSDEAGNIVVSFADTDKPIGTAFDTDKLITIKDDKNQPVVAKAYITVDKEGDVKNAE